MRTVRDALSVTRKEILSLVVSPVAYSVLAGFLLLAGYFFFNLLGTYNLKLAQYVELPVKKGSSIPNLQEWVVEPYFQILIFLLLFAAPFITMRVFAEEKRHGTFVLLSVSPLTTTSLVLGKYLAVFSLAVLMCLGSFSFPAFLWFYSSLEFALLVSAAVAVLCSAALFCVVGLVFSALTDRQILAGGATLCFSLVLYFSHSLADSVGPTFSVLVQNLSPVTQTENLVHGAVSLSNCAYFVSIVLYGLLASVFVVSYQREQ